MRILRSTVVKFGGQNARWGLSEGTLRQVLEPGLPGVPVLHFLRTSVNSRDSHESVDNMKSNVNPIWAVLNTNFVSQVFSLSLVAVVAMVPIREGGKLSSAGAF